MVTFTSGKLFDVSITEYLKLLAGEGEFFVDGVGWIFQRGREGGGYIKNKRYLNRIGFNEKSNPF
jgi:hypothetical protein